MSRFVKLFSLTAAIGMFPKTALAFYSPQSLQILSSTIGPWVQFFLTVIITAILSFAIKINTKLKKRIWIFLFGLLVIILGFIVFQYIRLKKLNTPDQTVFINELQGLTARQMKEIDSNHIIQFDEAFLNNRYVPLDQITSAEYDQYHKFVLLWYKDSEYPIKNAIYINFNQIWNAINFEQEKVFSYFKDLGIKKGDKILFLCHEGWSSSVISYFFNQHGYNSYYGNLHELNDVDFINSDEIKKNNDVNAIVLKPLQFDSRQKYFILLFGIAEEYLIERYPILKDREHLQKNIHVIKAAQGGLINLKDRYPRISVANIDAIRPDSKIICLSPLHCLLTKHKMHSIDPNMKILFSINTDMFNETYKHDSQ